MSDIIERYVNEVIKFLPVDERVEIKEELISNILEQVDEYDEEKTKEVLKSFGHPRVLASQYRSKKRYLIGPELLDSYLNILKVVCFAVIVFSLVMGVLNILGDFVASPFNLLGIFASFIVKSVSSFWEVSLSAFFWVTLGFAIYENFGTRKLENEWDPNELPELSDQQDIVVDGNKKRLISRVETIAELVIEMIFFSVFSFTIMTNAAWMALFTNGEIISIGDVINISVFRSFMGLFVLSFVLSCLVSIMKIVYAKWNTRLIISNLIYQLVASGITVMFFLRNDIVNPSIIDTIVKHTEFTQLRISDIIAQAQIVAILVVLIVAISEIGSSIYKCYFLKDTTN